MSDHYKDKRYVENRKRILAGSPTCAICGIRKANTVDHILELHAGGDHSMENLQPACAKCNYRKGAQYGNAQRARIVKARNEAVKTAETRRPRNTPKAPKTTKNDEKAEKPFFDDPTLTPTPPSSVYPKGSKRTKTDPSRSKPKAAEVDRSFPRLYTRPLGARNYAGEFAEWGERTLGISLFPWQRLALEGILSVNDEDAPPGYGLEYRTSLCSVARQNGKTALLKILVGGWLTVMAAERKTPQTVITTAHALDLAVSLFQDLAPILESHYGAKSKWSYGRNELRMPDGSLWLVRAATPSAGHGRSPDLIAADEVWDISEEVLDVGLIPSQRARKSPHLAMFSTAGTEASKLLLRWREQGLRAIDSPDPSPLFFAEWSPPPSADPESIETMEFANPSLGHMLELETIQAESKNPNRAAYLRGSLNLWVSHDSAWLDSQILNRSETADVFDIPPAVLSVDSSLDESRYVGVLTTDLGDRVLLETAFIVNSELALWENVRRLLPPGTRTILAVTPTLDLHTPKELEKRKTVVGIGELSKWTGLVRGMFLEGRVLHRGDALLVEHLSRAVMSRTQNGVVLSSVKSPGPIELARVSVFGIALASRARSTTRPSIATSRR